MAMNPACRASRVSILPRPSTTSRAGADRRGDLYVDEMAVGRHKATAGKQKKVNGKRTALRVTPLYEKRNDAGRPRIV